ncbi:flagellar hook-length control protein [Solidesulfovibrio fructosivorans JJ]]|uniref:Flagellar hook-length control protein n=1 Tax=Solidesulfovibrio fructosivorans JJ] TaxID=596151 RepID=E1K0M2_SOLFR|nr:flagellar hook-length control protein FliK [Solidesulfovibrio fructosivorans]EFL49874.1 flagellar hook-length control protein [Solidesulfovibrio fructosivorans JJ]]
MQILPLVTTRAQAAADATQQNAALTSRQSAMFASMLQSARSSTEANQVSSVASSASATTTVTDPMEAANTPSRQDLMNLPMTREDVAALHDDLVEQGFSEDEFAAMEQKAESPEGLTWGEMMHEVKKKISKTESNEKKEVSNEDTVQLLGLFGKLGFTADESQSMVDALGKGEANGVWSKISDKVASLGDNDSVSLSSSEMSTLGRTMNLSEAAQKRLTALFDQSNAESGLSGQGLRTAFGLVKNEVLSQLGQEAQSMQAFRQAASVVLDKAWQRQQTKISSDLHQDDVARKAAQVVAMGGEKKAKAQDVPTASQPGIDVLADVPDAGTSPLPKDGQGQRVQGQDVQSQQTQARQVHQDARGAGHGAQAPASELHGKAGAVATAQAAATGSLNATAGGDAQTASSSSSSGDAAPQSQVSHKQAASAPQFGVGNAASGNTGGSSGGQQGGGAGGSFEHGDQEGGWGEFWSKVRVDKSGGQAATGAGSNTSQTMAAMDAVAGSNRASAAKPFDAALAARAARQLETGILRNVGQDTKQLTLNLSPDELGKLSVTLTVKDKEVKAIIKADNTDTAAMLHDQAAHIKKTLEDQGFKVTKLEVQTGVSQDNQSAWQSPEQHNQAREQREAMERMRSSQRLARSGGGIALDADASGFVPQAATSAASGLDLFA